MNNSLEVSDVACEQHITSRVGLEIDQSRAIYLFVSFLMLFIYFMCRYRAGCGCLWVSECVSGRCGSNGIDARA
jgi:hypothetical protein